MDQENKDYSQPVAYDANGQPLYAHPPVTTATDQASSPEQPASQQSSVNDDVKARHDESVRLHPDLNLTDEEFVIMTVRRHPIALLLPLGLGVLLIGLAFSLLFNYDIIVSTFNLSGDWANPAALLLPVTLFSFLVALGMYISYYVYSNNRFHLTNESVIQKIQFSLLAKQEQTISLGDVEDVNYSQKGVLQLLLDYGSIRLSTTGDEHTYNFVFVARPKEHANALTNAVEAYKNGRRVETD